jgi:hypothetical protein
VGFQPLFYAADADRIAVATSTLRLLKLGAPTDLDEAALAVFLRLSHFLGGARRSKRFVRCRATAA